jgi:diguanylate cyclase (GGDEF)-like protein
VGDPAFSESRLQLFQTVAEQISLALANLALRETLRRQAIRDGLTNLFNRRYMEETLEREISRAQRKDAGLGLLMIDIDHFKSFNDDYGHDAGDMVLREVGGLLLNRTRKEDVACRYGGEEFLIIIPETGEDDALARAEELQAALCAMHLTYHERMLREVTVSIGVAVFPRHGSNVDNLLKAADLALYAAKRAGRNRVCLAGGSITNNLS